MFDYGQPVKVTVSDPDTGAVLEEKVLGRNDYVVITTGNRYIKSMQVWGQTHTVHIAMSKPAKVG